MLMLFSVLLVFNICPPCLPSFANKWGKMHKRATATEISEGLKFSGGGTGYLFTISHVFIFQLNANLR